MRLKALFRELAAGVPVKRKAWAGYWRYHFGKLEMHSKDGSIIPVTETKDILFTIAGILMEDWEIATEENCPVLAAEKNALIEIKE